MFGSTWGVFGLVIVKLYHRHDFDDAERRIAHDRARQLLAGNVFFDEHQLPISPILARELLRWMRVILTHNENPDA